MSEARVVRKPKYDGRTKKRQWEARRSDQGEALDLKKTKLSDVGEAEPFERVKRRKYALLLGYSGLNYFGMQRNPKTKTIEEDLFTALLKADYITKEAFEQVQTIQFQRAARTDKGVSAARQVVSLKLPDIVEIGKINNLLPEVIRIFGLKRVTKGFNSKSQCDGRTYTYMIPTVAFSKQKLQMVQETFRLDNTTYLEVNNLLNLFVGTKNFHNFTSKKKPNDPSAKRYIMSFGCEQPFLSGQVEFAVLKVKGQSFMLHQIRKMVGLIVAVVRGHTSEDIIKKSLSEETVNVPRAPGLGLMLDYVHYDRYNQRYGADGMHDVLEWNEEEQQVDAFKVKHIHPIVVSTEITCKNMMVWLDKLPKHRYDIMEDDQNINEIGSSSDEESSAKALSDKNL